MRIQRTNFLLTLKLKHSCIDDIMQVTAYGSDFEPLPMLREINNEIETIEISSYLPNTIMLVLSGKTDSDGKKFIELLDMSLAGLKINKDIMFNRLDYKPDLSTQLPTSLTEYLNLSSTRSTKWEYNGCVLFDLFDPDPFAFLLKIGNKIKF